MKKICIWFIAALAFGLVAFSTPATAEGQAVGDKWTIGNFCMNVDREFMRKFTNLVVRGGTAAYQAIITTPGSPCYESRHRMFSPVIVTLKERLWGFILPSGEELIMWLIVDQYGLEGYTWLIPDRKFIQKV